MKHGVRRLARPAVLGSAVSIAIAGIVMAGLPFKAIGADAPDPSLTGVTHPGRDLYVLARQLLMDSNETLDVDREPGEHQPQRTSLDTLKADAYAKSTPTCPSLLTCFHRALSR